MGRTVLPSARPRWPRALICAASRLRLLGSFIRKCTRQQGNTIRNEMSSSNRRTLLHRGRLRREKLRKLRQRYLKATTETERRGILERVSRIAPTVSAGTHLGAEYYD